MSEEATPQDKEKNTDDPANQLAQATEKIAQMARDLEDLQMEQKLMHKLAAAGAVDLETAVLVAKTRLNGKPVTELEGCVAQLRKEKAYLFGAPPQTAGPRKTAAVKDRGPAGATALAQAAQKAAQTGSRADVQQYLKLRRSLR